MNRSFIQENKYFHPGWLHRSFILLTALMLASCSILSDLPSIQQSDNAAQADETLIPVTLGDISSSVSFVGNLQYSQSAELSWKTSGVIDKVYVNVGDEVKKGDVLAELATDSLSSAVIIAEKTMIEQQEKLEDIKTSKAHKWKLTRL